MVLGVGEMGEVAVPVGDAAGIGVPTALYTMFGVQTVVVWLAHVPSAELPQAFLEYDRTRNMVTG